MMNKELINFFEEKIKQSKIQFERTVDCKHIEFDDLYPYMSEQPQFFWYKRYVAWQELITVVNLAGELDIKWTIDFTEKQIEYIQSKILDAKVLDNWYEGCYSDSEEQSR